MAGLGLTLGLLACGSGGGSGDGGAAPACDTGLSAIPAEGLSAVVDPDYGTLVTARWTQRSAARAWVEYSVDPGEWLSTPARDLQAGGAEALLLGLPYGHEVRFRVVNDLCADPRRSPDAVVHTAQAPEGLPQITAIEGDASRWDAETRYILTGMNDAVDGSRYWSFIIDRRGRVVWARQNPRLTVTLYPRVTRAGDALLIDENTFWGSFDGGAGSQVVELAIDGTVLHTYLTPGLRHPFTDGPDRSIAWGATQSATETLEIVGLDGAQRRIWDCQDFLDSRGMAGTCTSNSLWWDPETGRYLYSFYTLETIFEIDPEQGPLRWFGHLPGSWSFDPPDAAFWWQHGAHYTEAGTLLLSSYLDEDGGETVVREYALDEGARSLREIWRFGEGEGIFGEELGEAHRLPGGNTLHNYGTTPRLREITPGGEVVWDVQWDERYIGRSTPIGDLYAMLP